MKNITNFIKALFRIKTSKIKSSKKIQQIARHSVPPENVIKSVGDHLHTTKDFVFRKSEETTSKKETIIK